MHTFARNGAGRQVAQNPGIASALDKCNPKDLACPQDSRWPGVERQVPAACPESYLHHRSNAMSKVPIPPCTRPVRMRWQQFLLQIDMDPQVSGRFRGWVFWAAKQYDKEKQLGWTQSTCRALHRLLQGPAVTVPAALTAKEKRLATAILAHYSPFFSPIAYGAV